MTTVAWETSWSKAKERARAAGKPIFLDFFAPG
jgi:hypothetical protein